MQDILRAIRTVREYTQGMDEKSFKSNHMALDAVIRQLAIVGEAVTHLPKEMRDKEPEIPWKSVVGMRNILIHSYAEVDEATVWKAANSDLVSLEKCVKKLLKEDP